MLFVVVNAAGSMSIIASTYPTKKANVTCIRIQFELLKEPHYSNTFPPNTVKSGFVSVMASKNHLKVNN